MKRTTTTKTITINENIYKFELVTAKTAYGFCHNCKMYKNGLILETARVNWENRTWELYQYQQAILQAISKALDTVESDFTLTVKTFKGWHNLTAERKAFIQDNIQRLPRWRELRAVQDTALAGNFENKTL